MADQLTSVRFDAATLNLLRGIADVHDTNVAEEVRRAVKQYIHEVTSNDAFRDAANQSIAARQERVEHLLSIAARPEQVEAMSRAT